MQKVKNNGYDEVFRKKVKHLGQYMNLKLNMPKFKEVKGQIYKLCPKCKQYYPMTNDYFTSRSTTASGFASHCKKCDHKKEKKRVRMPSYNEAGELYCITCKQYKPESEFNKGDKRYKCRNGYSRECKHCESLRKQIQRMNKNTSDPIQYFKHLIYGCMTRSRLAGVECTLTCDDLIQIYEQQDRKCYFSNIPMTTIRSNGKQLYNASIDRIEPGGSYNKSNIRLVCNQVNMMRSNLSDEEFINICKKIVQNELH